MKSLRKSLPVLASIGILFFAVNYRWSHAALAWSVNDRPCPQDLLTQAETDILAFFGSKQSRPLIICQKEPVLGHYHPYGTVNFAPFLPAIVSVGVHGFNRDVMAHEYAHAELATRTGFFPRLFHVPTWFDEGLAMQLDHRENYSRQALQSYLQNQEIKKSSLQDIRKAGGFFRMGIQGRYHYALSRCIVESWLNGQPGKQPLKLISSIGWFSPFPHQQFERHQKSCMESI